MFVQVSNQTQTRLERINRELAALQDRRLILESQQTRIDLLHRFQQQGVTRPHFESFQQARGRLLF